MRIQRFSNLPATFLRWSYFELLPPTPARDREVEFIRGAFDLGTKSRQRESESLTEGSERCCNP
jgi:hypothetical protein